MQKTIYTFLGPSGSGKSTLVNLLKSYGIPELVSHTTRKPRQGEVEGVNYYYVTLEEFEKLEMVERVVYSGNHYCLSKNEVNKKLDKYDKVTVVVDRVGVEKLKQIYGDMVKVIYVYCNEDTLYQRMLDRGDSPEQARKRIEYLHEEGELNNINLADYVVCSDKHSLDVSAEMVRYFCGVTFDTAKHTFK